MNQKKIGSFIASLRKEKNMTQLDLANKLQITDRAISKWENGRGMPDISLLEPLCKELDITLNELLSGERLNSNEYETKFEENILNTMKDSKQNIKKSKQTLRFTIFSILLLIVFISSIFLIDINRMNHNQPVLFSTWGLKYAPPIDLKQEEIELAISDYLVNKNDAESKHYNNEKWFVSFHTYLIEEYENGN